MSGDLHRRKPSREDADSVLAITVTAPEQSPNVPASPTPNGDHSPRKPVVSVPERPTLNSVYASAVPHRQRVLSTPSHPSPPPFYSPVLPQPPSAGALQTTFGAASAPRTRPSHARTPSASASSFFVPSPSPLSMSFPAADAQQPSSVPNPHRQAPPPPIDPHRRRQHARIHSRNLSIYFPRPGTLPAASIAEDGAQELELLPAPETVIGSAPLQEGRELESGFRFGGKRATQENGGPGNGSPVGPVPPVSAGGIGRTSRRGHHHKHSLSHNFFSFMEPEASVHPPLSATTTSVSSLSPYPSTPLQPTAPAQEQQQQQHINTHPHSLTPPNTPSISVILTSPAFVISLAEFSLGSALWLSGQQCGSLACTGLGYWVVFDAFGVACSDVLPSYLEATSVKNTSRSYGNSRIETLAVFVQSLYLIFASIYVSKETLEHLLLSHGESHHHHHPGDDTGVGLEFPVILILLSLLFLATTSIGFDNNYRLINATANRIPSLQSLFQTVRNASKFHFVGRQPLPRPTTTLGKTISNPYATLPAGTALGILGISGLLRGSQHRPADLFLAGLVAVLTFGVAYPASLALAKVLLQTAPERGQPDGRMEAFLRTMRDIERHSQVLHLPPPHIWQKSTLAAAEDVVVTLELHIRKDMADTDAVELTRWAWERCIAVLGSGSEVTVGFVKG